METVGAARSLLVALLLLGAAEGAREWNPIALACDHVGEVWFCNN